MQNQIEELVTFLKMNERADIQSIALQCILDLSGNQDFLETICKVPDILEAFIVLIDKPNMAKASALNLVNISANEKGAEALINLKIINILLNEIWNPESTIADACCMILSNITRPKHLVDVVIPFIDIKKIINVFTKTKFNNKEQNLYYLGPVLSNLSQSHSVRKEILDENDCIVQKLLPFTEYMDSLVKRGGVVGTLRNCCFENNSHNWLLSDSVDILPRLLLPLAGNNELDDEDNEKLPLELQYLSSDKKREEDPDIRCMLLDAISQLCASRINRKFIRNKNTYVILRELHKWETDPKCLSTCESLVNILIRTEEEIGVDNIKDIIIPDNLQEEFNKTHGVES